ncbi:putative glycosyl hydrolase, family 18 [Xylariales sp. PMI_506]|nr:putative glycosyl hydrolase, family 18 [Xylariales sp. PMI_506]
MAQATCGMRYLMYFDQYHLTALPPKNLTGSITHVVTAFANTTLFIGETAGDYTPFMNVSDVRAMFNNGTKVGIALGGWGDTSGFSAGAATNATRLEYAANVAAMIESLDFDFVDIDWEYPGGNGEDYRQTPNADKVSEITTYPLLLQAIKDAIAPKELSIAVPGLERDMIAFTEAEAPSIWAAVDWVNVMTYDLMNRRDNATKHHTDVNGSLATIESYLDLGLDPAKINLGMAYYAKYFETEPGYNCSAIGPVGCPIVTAELADGSDAGTSGAITFEAANYAAAEVPTDLTVSADGSCGTGTTFTCLGAADNATCCSQYGYCGNTAAHCGAGCQSGYGDCTGPAISTSFLSAMENGITDEDRGGQWWWDSDNALFWTFDTVDLIQRKFEEIVAAKGLGGVMAWSFGEDSYDYSHIQAMSDGVQQQSAAKKLKRSTIGHLEHSHARLH